MSEQKYAVEMIDISKSFGSVEANRHVTFHVEKGEIHAIVGENGAGKTTLMNILFGALQPTSGTIRIDGKEEKINSSNHAIQLGIGMVHQHFELVPAFTVAQNVLLGHEPRMRFGRIDQGKMYRDVQDLSDHTGLKIDAHAKVGTLSVGLRQRVEILKALSCGARILILDEPTAVLTPLESEELFEVLRRMSAEGKTIIIITHKLKEVMEIADHITVLRRGETQGTLDKKATDEKSLAALMMGQNVQAEPFIKQKRPEGRPLLSVRGISVPGKNGRLAVDDVSFDVMPGEILTIAGVEGNGQTALVNALLGFSPLRNGSITADGADITAMPVNLRRRYCSYIPEDRMTMGLDLDATVHDNLICGLQADPDWKRGPFLDYGKTRRHVSQLIDDYSIRTDGMNIPASSLSGGNQQKIVAAREMNFQTRILIVSQPTRGVDIGASRFIHERLVEMRNRGCAIVLISTDLEEVFQLSDRIKVIYEGRIVATVSPDSITPEDIGLYMTGAKKAGQSQYE